MPNISSLLQKYYKREGNRIIFINGMTLNQLALAMWEKLGYSQIDASVISRVIKGERDFTYKQLLVFCDLLDLASEERIYLKNALNQSILQRHNIDFNFDKLSKVVAELDEKFADNLLSVIRLLQEKGKHNTTIEIARLFENLLLFKTQLTKKDQQVLAKIYNEKSRAIGLVENFEKVLEPMNLLSQKAIEIGKNIKDRDILNMAYIDTHGQARGSKHINK